MINRRGAWLGQLEARVTLDRVMRLNPTLGVEMTSQKEKNIDIYKSIVYKDLQVGSISFDITILDWIDNVNVSSSNMRWFIM